MVHQNSSKHDGSSMSFFKLHVFNEGFAPLFSPKMRATVTHRICSTHFFQLHIFYEGFASFLCQKARATVTHRIFLSMSSIHAFFRTVHQNLSKHDGSSTSFFKLHVFLRRICIMEKRATVAHRVFAEAYPTFTHLFRVVLQNSSEHDGSSMSFFKLHVFLRRICIIVFAKNARNRHPPHFFLSISSNC